MSENEINDNLMMLKCFLQEEGDENWEDYCNAIQGILNLYNKEKEKNKEIKERIEYYYSNGGSVSIALNDIRELFKERN